MKRKKQKKQWEAEGTEPEKKIKREEELMKHNKQETEEQRNRRRDNRSLTKK
jgi:hypothetical protein